ncbi:RNA polymerase factor sigma-54 [Roseateles sp. DAIF2]|nr:RNA polymerase factor sigma-54 [Roseateles sp. DAIF2]
MMDLHSAQKQQQAISPRLQHAVRLLQMSSLDFAALVQEQLGRNPFLEVEDGDGGPAGQADAEAADSGFDIPFDEREPWRGEGSAAPRRAEDEELAALERMPEPTSLKMHLQGQLNVLSLPARDLLLASIIVESLDADGYLRSPLPELAEVAELLPPADPAEMQIALKRVQALDPAGVGARSVAECLELQLPAIDCPLTRELAGLIVTQHLPMLAARDVMGLAHALRATPARIEAVCRRLRRLDPHPGWRYETAQPPYVLPDVLTRRVRGQWRVLLNPAVVPRVRFNQVYAELFQRHRARGDGEMASHLQEARWTVRNVEQRFATILDVAAAIVRRQRHFLEFGAMAMKPLALREIADEVGVHESTVSRVTNNKYMATPAGVYELKYFFSRPLLSRNGSACSGTAIRGLIKDLIEAEVPQAPLSDAEIARQLGQQGLMVARRTVTKYRQMLRIEAVERRRSHA